jgi:ABC-type sugar transport system ATPase subunit
MRSDTILEFQDISKGFPGVQALSKVSFPVQKGEIHAIVGENGAGKSTLMKIVAGLYRPDEGKIFLEGQEVDIRNPQVALGLGIAMVPQELNLVPEMTVAENILLGIEPRNRMGVVDRGMLNQKAGEILKSLEVQIRTRTALKYLTVAEQQLIQIARALANQCKILIMDEPTAALSEKEKISLFDRLNKLNESGTTILYISHRMEEIFEISDQVTVLRDGKLTGTLKTNETNQNQVVNLMIGRELQEFLHVRNERKHEGAPLLEICGFTRKGQFEDISFTLRKGEILGFAGLVGAGRTEVMSSIFGAPGPESGEIRLNGNKINIKSPIAAIQAGIGYVPEERKRQGIFPIMSVLHNLSIPFVEKLQKFLVVLSKRELEIGDQLSNQLRVVTPSLNKQIVYLSGGNQQKVILARWIGSGASILILDEPTRGIDINAKSEIHALIEKLALEGKSIIMVSSETQELLAIADRILIMREGKIVGEVYADETSEEEILRLAMLNSSQTQQMAYEQTIAA